LNLIGYIDSDWGNCVDDLKNISRYIFFLRTCFFSWCWRKQETTAQKIVVVEYIAIVSVLNQVIW